VYKYSTARSQSQCCCCCKHGIAACTGCCYLNAHAACCDHCLLVQLLVFASSTLALCLCLTCYRYNFCHRCTHTRHRMSACLLTRRCNSSSVQPLTHTTSTLYRTAKGGYLHDKDGEGVPLRYVYTSIYTPVYTIYIPHIYTLYSLYILRILYILSCYCIIMLVVLLKGAVSYCSMHLYCAT
jgi:hypothetical protein